MAEMGTLSEVARLHGVHHSTVAKWLKKNGLVVEPHPEKKWERLVRRLLERESDRIRVAQWIMDEGTISLAYHIRLSTTSLIIMGGMNDVDALSPIANILESRISSSKLTNPGTLPMHVIRIQGAKAYAILEVIRNHLAGLKRLEAEAVLAALPRSGVLRGRHTTDEFYLEVWKTFAVRCLETWNSRKRMKMSEDERHKFAATWVTHRVARAKRWSRKSDSTRFGARTA